MRVIDADALTKEIKQDIADNGITERYVFYRINEAPSIDIVRCGECKHWSEKACHKFLATHPSSAYDFCSHGERKESE